MPDGPLYGLLHNLPNSLLQNIEVHFMKTYFYFLGIRWTSLPRCSTGISSGRR
ncbi:hypothetical protein T45_01092 [Streptomyces turgidiscabies]|nr:hypothetical protein T45_01092 [Streptomyces turgidiscabies]